MDRIDMSCAVHSFSPLVAQNSRLSHERFQPGPSLARIFAQRGLVNLRPSFQFAQ